MIILASASKARRRLIKICKKNIILKKSNIDESRLDNEDLYQYLMRITYLKAFGFIRKGCKVISADTIIVYKDDFIGKPKNREDAFGILSKLSGEIHYCFTGVTILSEQGYDFFVDYAILKMSNLSKKDIEFYLDKGEFVGKAAGYAIQGCASSFIKIVKGDTTTVIGLPMKKLCKII